MKKSISPSVLPMCLLTLIFSPVNSPGQSPPGTFWEDDDPATRAVVIGISDYQHPNIPDLQFAHRDAEAFAGWLSSGAGSAGAGASVQTLLNEQATTGQIVAALDGLISASKAGDVAIIYFSGHGDVERVTKFQRGYWLTYDSPPAAYAAGAFSLVFLQDIITTLAEAGVQVVVISDACRAGKLAGSEFGGAQATTAALSQQFANEIKILSCQPNEFSLEGLQWGGGRGCFSYHLLDALYGMADANADGAVNLLELGRYLEDRVPAETAPHPQIPMALGNRSALLATVDAETLAQWQKQKTGDALAFHKIDSKGLEDLVLAKADTGILEMYHAFMAALETGNLMSLDSSDGPTADDYYKLLIKEPAIAELHGLMTRNFAAALMDEGQQLLNRLVMGDLKAWEILENELGISHRQIAAKYHRAAGLLGEKHYYYKRLKANAIYFDTYDLYNLDIPFDSIWALDIEGTRKAHLLDPTAPHMLMNLTYLLPIDSIDYYIERLEELAPNWSFWHNIVAKTYKENGLEDKAIQFYQRSISLDSSNLVALTNISRLLDSQGRSEEATNYRAMAIRVGLERAGKEPASLACEEWQSLAGAFYAERRYRNAEWTVLQNDRFNPNVFAVYERSWQIYSDMGKYEEALKRIMLYHDHYGKSGLENWIGNIYFISGEWGHAERYYMDGTLDSLTYEGNFDANRLSLAMLYKKTGKLAQARTVLNAIENKEAEYFFELAEILRLEGQGEEANSLYDSLLNRLDITFQKNNISSQPNYWHQIIALHRIGKTAEMKQAIETANKALQGDRWHHFRMACAYAQTGQVKEAFRQLDLSEKAGWHPNSVLWIQGTVYDPLLDPLRPLSKFRSWEKRWSPPYEDLSK